MAVEFKVMSEACYLACGRSSAVRFCRSSATWCTPSQPTGHALGVHASSAIYATQLWSSAVSAITYRGFNAGLATITHGHGLYELRRMRNHSLVGHASLPFYCHKAMQIYRWDNTGVLQYGKSVTRKLSTYLVYLTYAID